MIGSIRVLLIDDETVFANGLTSVLTRRGMLVRTAADGILALELLERETFDVLVLDMRMPGMDGVEVLKSFRDRDAVTPVIVLTGQVSMTQTREALKHGASEVILKPCPIETLVSSIENAFERKCLATDVAERA